MSIARWLFLAAVASALGFACSGGSPPAGPGDGGQGASDGGDGAAADSTADGPRCTSNADCDPVLQFCQKSACAASAPGVCATRPGTRTTGYCMPGTALVCGCDGKVYDDACLANAEGVNVASQGACPLPEGGAACATTKDCGTGLYCKTATCGAASGTCEPMPAFLTCTADASVTCVDSGSGGTTCTENTALACGCDHETYADDCEAASYGINVAAEGACPPLPSGPCTSQADCGGASYAALVFCKPSTCGQVAGTCTPIPGACPALYDPVCGCNGQSYLNSCLSDQASVGDAYGGPCRSGAIVACSPSAPCPGSQMCANDPRAACDGGAGCAGVCVDGPSAACSGGCSDPVYQACVATQCASPPCDQCVFTAGTTCSAGSPCPAGQLCFPTAGPSVCVVP